MSCSKIPRDTDDIVLILPGISGMGFAAPKDSLGDNVQSYAQICEVISARLGKAVAKRPVPKQHGDHYEQVKRGFNTRQGSRDVEGG